MAKILLQELSGLLKERTNLNTKQAEQFMSAVFNTIYDGLERDGIVKVRGLGTFKIITVDARESVSVNTGERLVIEEHSKVTFTPDNTMKELVNRPFSQFETVVLNEGVTFDDETLDEMLNEQEISENEFLHDEPQPVADIAVEEAVTGIAEQEAAVEEVPMSVADIAVEEVEAVTDVAEQEVAVEEEPMFVANITEEKDTAVSEEEAQPAAISVEEEETFVEEEPQPVTVAAVEEVAVEETVEPDAEEDDQPPVSSTNWWKWAVAAVLLIIVAGLGYTFLYDRTKDESKVMLQVEAVEPTKQTDTLKTKSSNTGDSNATTASSNVKTDAKTDAQSDSEKLTYTVTNPVKYGLLTQEEKDKIKREAVKYEEKDQRVRTGGYYIRGLDFELRVRPNDDLKRIARRTVGEELVCYLAVYNNLNETDSLRTGQKIRIPKLIMKKRVLK